MALSPIVESPKLDDSPQKSGTEHAEEHEPITLAANPENISVEGDYNMVQTTEIYTSVETYVHYLNTDVRLGTPTLDEVSLLDRDF